MDENQKRIALVAVAILAVAAAAFSGFNALRGEELQPGQNNDLPPGSKTGKQLEIEAMQGGAREERDLGGEGR
jgi:hypothetical protein